MPTHSLNIKTYFSVVSQESRRLNATSSTVKEEHYYSKLAVCLYEISTLLRYAPGTHSRPASFLQHDLLVLINSSKYSSWLRSSAGVLRHSAVRRQDGGRGRKLFGGKRNSCCDDEGLMWFTNFTFKLGHCYFVCHFLI